MTCAIERHSARVLTLAVAALSLLFGGIGSARTLSQNQTPAVTRVAAPKEAFVEGLRQFLEAIAGQYGDEAIRGRAAINAMEIALDDWDRTIQAYQADITSRRQTTDAHRELGLMLLDRRRIDDAVRELAAAAALDPKNADVHTLRGFAFVLADKPAEATREFARAATLDPANPATSYRLSQYLARAAQQDQAAKARQQFRQSMSEHLPRSVAGAGTSPFIRVELLRQVANVAPIFPPARYGDGFDALKKGKYAEAVALFRDALAGDPISSANSAQERMWEGSAALRQGQLSVALGHLRASLQAGENVSEIHRLLGMALWADDQYENSVEQFNAAIRLRPDDERSRVALADALVSAGKTTEAEQAFKDAIGAVPTSGMARYRLGRLYDSQRRWAEAAQMFQGAVAFNPVVGLDYLYQTIARDYLSQPDFERAIDAASRQIEINPNNAEAHRSLGDMYLRTGRHDEALTELLAALLINPSSAESYGSIAQVDLTTGKYAEAVEASGRSLQLDPRNSAAQYALATALIRLDRIDEGTRELERFQELQRAAQAGEQRDLEVKMLQQEASTSLTKDDYDAAIAALQKVVSLDPASATAYLTLGVVLKKAGHQREAIDSLTRAADLNAGPDAFRLLAETYDAMGQAEESQKHRAAYERMKAERLRRAGWNR